MRFLSMLCVVVLWLLGTGAALAADKLNGRYFGIDDATGASITIRPSGSGYTGTFSDAQGNSESFKAEAIDDVAETDLLMDRRVVLVRMSPLPYGIQVTIVPYKDADGALDIDASRSAFFLREGVKAPKAPADFVAAPRAGCQRVAAYSFMVSYEFWPPAGVMNGYLCLPERARTLMRFFPAIKLDVVWKVCLAPDNRAALSRALRGTGLDCKTVIAALAGIQRRNQFDRYKQEVAVERKVMTMAMRCGEGYPETKQNCDWAAREMSKAALSLRTPSDVLRNYR